MKALVLHELSGPRALRLDEVPEPPAGDGVLIEVRAAGVSYPDLLISYGRYQVRPEPPVIPGAEVAGVVLNAPSDSQFRAGDRVSAITLVGGYAEQVVAAPDHVLPLPAHTDFADGAAMVSNHQTAYFALHRRAGLIAGDSVLVLGSAGGLGSAAIQVAKALDAMVIAGVHREGAEDFLRDLGADEVVRLRDGWLERVRELTGGRGVDVVVDPVGGELFDDAVRALAPEGRLLVLGFAGGGIPQVKVNRLLLRNVSVVGAGWGDYVRRYPGALVETGAALAALVEKGMRPPITARYPLERGAQALIDVEQGRVLGKVVLTLES